MTASLFKVRRAIVDDRNALVALWQSMGLDAGTLEKRLTEFQVVSNEQDEVVGTIGVRLAGKHGLIHGEAYADFALADQFRTLLWDRLQSLATNHGLVRLWTCESAPYWRQVGMQTAGDAELETLPADWAPEGAAWLTLKLREDVDEVINVDREFTVFMEAEKERSRQMMDHAKMWKLVATLLSVALFLAVIGFGIWMMTKNPGLLRR